MLSSVSDMTILDDNVIVTTQTDVVTKEELVVLQSIDTKLSHIDTMATNGFYLLMLGAVVILLWWIFARLIFRNS